MTGQQSSNNERSKSRVVSIYREQRIGRILADLGRLTDDDLSRVAEHQSRTGLRFGEAARQLGLVTEADVQYALSRQFDFGLLSTPPEFELSRELITAHLPFDHDAEAFRALRSQLTVMWFQTGRRMLAVVGAGRDVGCSYVAGNLAVVFSQIGANTLLIDADMRRPRLAKMFGMDGGRLGLSDILVHRAEVSQTIVHDVVPGLSFLAAGTEPPNPQELLNRMTFGEFVDFCGHSYDVVLLDTPPGNESTDAQIISGRAGGALIVARANRTHTSDVAAFSDLITSTGAHVVGSLLNEF